MRSFFAPATQFRPLLVTFCLTIHLHLQTLSLKTQPLNSEPACFWKAASVSPRSPNLEPVLVFCAALEPGSLGGGGW